MFFFSLKKDKTIDGTLDDAKKKLAKYTMYRGAEKPPRVEDKAVLEALNKTIQTRLKLDKKPAFVPPPGQSIDEIKDNWRQMEELEKGFEVSELFGLSSFFQIQVC